MSDILITPASSATECPTGLEIPKTDFLSPPESQRNLDRSSDNEDDSGGEDWENVHNKGDGENQLICLGCTTLFASKDILIRHVLQNHPIAATTLIKLAQESEFANSFARQKLRSINDVDLDTDDEASGSSFISEDFQPDSDNCTTKAEKDQSEGSSFIALEIYGMGSTGLQFQRNNEDESVDELDQVDDLEVEGHEVESLEGSFSVDATNAYATESLSDENEKNDPTAKKEIEGFEGNLLDGKAESSYETISSSQNHLESVPSTLEVYSGEIGNEVNGIDFILRATDFQSGSTTSNPLAEQQQSSTSSGIGEKRRATIEIESLSKRNHAEDDGDIKEGKNRDPLEKGGHDRDGEEKQICVFCKEGFNSMESLSSHIMNFHNEETIEFVLITTDEDPCNRDSETQPPNLSADSAATNVYLVLENEFLQQALHPNSTSINAENEQSQPSTSGGLEKESIIPSEVCITTSVSRKTSTQTCDQSTPCSLPKRIKKRVKYTANTQISSSKKSKNLLKNQEVEGSGTNKEANSEGLRKMAKKNGLNKNSKGIPSSKDTEGSMDKIKKKTRSPLIIPDYVNVIQDGGCTKYKCTLCRQQTPFKTKANVKYHVYCAKNPEEKPLRCDKCGERFIAGSHFKAHLLKHNGEKPYVCTWKNCSKSYYQQDKLTRHIKWHTGEKPYACQKCSKRFANAADLRGHNFTHTGERPHSCIQCDAKFALRANLQKHIHRMHSGNEPRFSCDQCGKRFFDRWTLNTHKVTHSGERPHVCKVCGKGFYLEKDLNRHFLCVHTENTPFKCRICEIAFNRKDNRDRHMNSQHDIAKSVSQKSEALKKNLKRRRHSSVKTLKRKRSGKKRVALPVPELSSTSCQENAGSHSELQGAGSSGTTGELAGQATTIPIGAEAERKSPNKFEEEGEISTESSGGNFSRTPIMNERQHGNEDLFQLVKPVEENMNDSITVLNENRGPTLTLVT